MNLESRFPVSAALIIAVVAAGIFSTRKPFHSHRPGGESRTSMIVNGLERVPARMWEDPLHAIARRGDDQASSIDGTTLQRLRQAIDRRSNPEPAGDQQPAPCLNVLPVLLPGMRHPENRESRRRARYAILAGLATAKFLPDDPDAIGAFELQYKGPKSTKASRSRRQVGKGALGLTEQDMTTQSYGADRDRVLHIGFELFRGAANCSALVLWLNTDEVIPGPSYRALAHVFEKLQLGAQHRITVIGPRTSDKLKDLVTIEATPETVGSTLDRSGLSELLKFRMHCDLRFVSPTATIDHTEIDRLARGNPAVRLHNHLPGTTDSTGDAIDPTQVLPIHRATLSDRHLMQALVAELHRRGVDCGASDAVRIGLISEWDTLYARAMTASFVAAAGKTTATFKGLSCYSYMRGLDGALEHVGEGHATAAHAAEAARRQPSLAQALNSNAHLEEPTGTSQWDYVRRLGARMRAELAPGQRYGAIGILGSDFFDKQLVLQSLRRRFPGVVFFTTDLDARWSQLEDYDSYRNLVIASSFHFQLNTELQGTIPPFREGYQSATYLATLFAVDHTPRFALAPQPLLFEIARSGPRWLNHNEHAGSIIHPQPPTILDRIARRIGPLLVLLILTLAGVYYILWRKINHAWDSRGSTRRAFFTDSGDFFPRRGWSIILVTAAVLLTGTVALIVADGIRGHGEPFALFEGVSVWPSVLIRIVVMLLAVRSLRALYRQLNDTETSLEQTFNLPDRATRIARGPWWQTRRGSWQRLEQGAHARGWISIRRLWTEYKLNSRRVWWRALAGSLVLCGLSYTALYVDAFPASPARGGIARAIDYGSALLATFLVFVVWCHGIEIIRNALSMLRCMRQPELRWGPGRRAATGLRRAESEVWQTRFLSELTQVPMRALVDPFLLMFLVICSAYPVFDTWHVTVLEVLLLCLFAAILIVAAILLRNATEANRQASLTRIRALRDQRRRPATQPATAYDQFHDEVASTQTGAFASFTHNPILHALSIPVGGFGGLALLEAIVAFV